jgi:hypothetical protein
MDFWLPVVISVVVNVAVIAFTYGKLHQSVSDIKERLGLADEANIRRNEKTERWENKMEAKELVHIILPECSQEFININRELAALSTKVDTLINMRKQ